MAKEKVKKGLTEKKAPPTDGLKKKIIETPGKRGANSQKKKNGIDERELAN